MKRLFLLGLVFHLFVHLLQAQTPGCTAIPGFYNDSYKQQFNNSEELYSGGQSGYCLSGQGQTAVVIEPFGCGVQTPFLIDPITYEMRLEKNFNGSCQINPSPNYCLESDEEITFASDLMISEYVDDSKYLGNVICIEIYNGTGNTIPLSGYALDVYPPGNTIVEASIPLTSAGHSIIQQDGTLVLCSLGNYFSSYAEYTDIDVTGQFTYTYKNSYALTKNGVIIDLFGNIGCDGSENTGGPWIINDVNGNGIGNGGQEIKTFSNSVRRMSHYIDLAVDDNSCAFVLAANTPADLAWKQDRSANPGSLGHHPESAKEDFHSKNVITILASNQLGMAPRGNVIGKTGNYTAFESTVNCGMEMNVFVSNNSWGTLSDCFDSPGSVNKDKLGAYTDGSEDIDIEIYNSPEHLMCKSAGNMDACYGTPGYDLMDIGAATSKNNMVVGAVTEYGNASYASSKGPTDDLRIKPDIMASPNNSNVATSYSTPIVTGAALLLHEQWDNFVSIPHPYNVNPHDGSPYPLASTMKGLLIHTAVPCSGNASLSPNHKCGWGILNVQEAADIIAENYQNSYNNIQELSYDGNDIYITFTAKGTEDLKATLCWTDVPGQAVDQSFLPQGVGHTIGTPVLTNDLDIELIDGVSNASTLPWTLDVSDPLGPAIRANDYLNNVEKVVLSTSELVVGRTYTLKISGKGVMEDLNGNPSSQKFSVIISGANNLTLGNAGFNICDEVSGSNIYTENMSNDIIIAKEDFIISNDDITNNANVQLAAGGFIKFLDGFETFLGVTMCAFIHDCDSNSSAKTSSSSTNLEEHRKQIFSVYPNPISSTFFTKIQLEAAAKVSIELYNLSGQKIKVLAENSQLEKGTNILEFDSNLILPGTYICRIKTKDHLQTQKINILR